MKPLRIGIASLAVIACTATAAAAQQVIYVVRHAESEYDNLFIVTRPVTGEPILVRLRF